MKAIKSATDFVLANPKQAWEEYGNFKPQMTSELNRKKFERCFAYFSDSLYNVHRDWNKVNNYGKRLKFCQMTTSQTTPMSTCRGQNPRRLKIQRRLKNLCLSTRKNVRLVVVTEDWFSPAFS